MAKNIIVVESPAKAKTITKYLGRDFKALASYGHVRDLKPKTGAVDPDQDFAMHYTLIDRNKEHVDKIAKALRDSDALYLATDPDREGEAISWHLYEILRERSALDGKKAHRVEFYEFTEEAIQNAVKHPRKLSPNLINAQQARRALDYLVGFNLSPLLWKKVRQGLSAGRVQSPALRMIVEREEEIERFEPREYWTIEADLEKGGNGFLARLVRHHGTKVQQFSFTSEEQAQAVREELLAAAGSRLSVSEVTSKQRKRRPAPPFITSTLQQEAARKLGMSAQKTMRIAQQLYEGVDIEGTTQGLITYMRTDSVSLARSAIQELRDTIEELFGKDKLPERPNHYRTKSKNAQEAHEAVRPTSSARTPETVRKHLTRDQARLYELVWKRTVACQMKPATLNTVSVEFACGEGNVLRATGSTVVDPGFLAVYEEGQDDRKDSEEARLPALRKGDVVDVKAIRGEQHFTEPPPRYTEASLVKALEDHGIGRPSTYASIISTLLNREYVELDNRRFIPTEVGKVVSRFLSNHFTRYVDYDFTARLEDELDAVSRGEKEWVPLLKDFWNDFKPLLDDKEARVTREEAASARELGTDPESGRPVSVRMGRYGPYAQIGTRDDEEKPRFAGLRPGQKLDTITLEEALKLFELPRQLGETPEGEALSVNIGRFGPYVRFGNRYASLGEDDDPFEISRERALELVAEKKQIDANRVIQDFGDEGIRVLNGRYGPYVTDGTRNAKVPKDREPASLGLEECRGLLANAPARKGRRGGRASGSGARTKRKSRGAGSTGSG